jgi:hypothetical protein
VQQALGLQQQVQQHQQALVLLLFYRKRSG